MTRATFCRAAGRAVTPLAGLAVGLFLVSVYFVSARSLSSIVVAAVCLAGASALVTGRAERDFAIRVVGCLALATAFIVLGAIFSPEISGKDSRAALTRIAAIALFVLAWRVALGAFGGRALLTLVFVAGATSCLISIALHLAAQPPLGARITLLGRPVNPIPAAAAAAMAALAGAALWRAGLVTGKARWAAGAGFLIIVTAMALTQSRGCAVGLVAALAVLAVSPARRGKVAAAVTPVVFLIAPAIILAETSFREAFCASSSQFICRPSERLSLWRVTIDLIAAQPLFGYGATFRLGEGWLNNPQNAALGMALYFGLPFLALCLAGLAALLARMWRARPGAALDPCAAGARATLDLAFASIVFSGVYFAFEPNPLAFYNAHWLFFWAPVATILAAGQTRPAGGAQESDDPALQRASVPEATGR